MANQVLTGFLWSVAEAISPLIVAALGWVAIKTAQYIRAKTKNEYVQGVLLRINDAVLAAVREVNQVAVRELKKAHADGKLTDAEKAQVRQMALDTAKAHFGHKGLEHVMKALGVEDVDRVFGSRIEAKVAELAEAAPTPEHWK